MFSVYGKFLLKDDRIHLCRIGISAKAEVTKTVSDRLSFITANPLDNMRMMSDDHISPLIDCQMCKRYLIFIRDSNKLIAPVKNCHNNFRSVFFEFCNITFYLWYAFQMIIQLIDTEKSDFDAFDPDHRRIIVAKSFDSIFFQGIYRILKALLSIVMAVVICHICCFPR